jgi:GTP-binding protein Era
MNRRMVTAATEALNEADVVCMIADATASPGADEAYLLDLVARVRAPRVLALNKVDAVNKGRLLPRIEAYAERDVFREIVPVSALTGDGCDVLLEILWRLLPEGPPLYDPSLLTIHPERFLVAERIREKVLENTREEVPYSTAVLIEGWEEEPGEGGGLVRIYASILADRPGQKGILVGHAGAMIKKIGTAARKDLEGFLGRRVYLDLQVKLEPGWRENRRILGELDRDLVGWLGS